MADLTILGEDASLQTRLCAIHDAVREVIPAIARIAVAIYDAKTDRVRTFVHSTDGEAPFIHYDRELRAVASLAALAAAHRDRWIGDLSETATAHGSHTRRLLEVGFRSSYTVPFYDHGRLHGFIFFDSREPDSFGPATRAHLAVYAHLIRLMVIDDLRRAHELRSAVQVAKDFGHAADAETGAHLDRMANYAWLIAKGLAAADDDHGIDDEFAEFIYEFAPLHDIGKIRIPERILMKGGPLTEDEFRCMQTHVDHGAELVGSIAANFGVGKAQHVDMLCNIVRHHHEAVDGSGYPARLTGDAIPIEARIVAVADVFDALTSKRCYKPAWPIDQAYDFMRRHAGSKFDAQCVAALLSHRDEVERLRLRFINGDADHPGFHEAYAPDL